MPENPRKKKKLSARDEKFVDLVAKGEPASSAYIKAGHKVKNARVSASKRLTNPNIRTALFSALVFCIEKQSRVLCTAIRRDQNVGGTSE